MGDAFLPSTVRMMNRLITWLEGRPRLYSFVHKVALRHDKAMDYRKYGRPPFIRTGAAHMRRSHAAGHAHP